MGKNNRKVPKGQGKRRRKRGGRETSTRKGSSAGEAWVVVNFVIKGQPRGKKGGEGKRGEKERKNSNLNEGEKRDIDMGVENTSS